MPNHPLESVNVYLIGDEEEWSLVDCGLPCQAAFESLEQQINDLGIRIEDIDNLLITHSHPDHSGLAERIKRISGAKVYVHKNDAPIVTGKEKEMFMVPGSIQHWLEINGMPKQTIPEQIFPDPNFNNQAPCEVDIELEGGEVVNLGSITLEVIWTLGHSMGHVCYYDRENRMLFTGDHILPIITPAIAVMPGTHENPLAGFMESMNVLEKYEVDLVLPAHQQPFTDLHGRLRELREHHNQRLSETYNNLEEVGRSAFQIMIELNWTGIGGEIIKGRALPASEQPIAICETLAHLEFLRSNGSVVKTTDEPVVLYKKTNS